MIFDAIMVAVQEIVKSICKGVLLVNRGLAKLIHLASSHSRFQTNSFGLTMYHFLILMPTTLFATAYNLGMWNVVDYPLVFLSFGLVVHSNHVYRELSESKVHGSAKFTNLFDLMKNGLTGIGTKMPKGIVFGRNAGSIVIKPSNKDGHVLVMGGSGDGKTKAFATPSLLNWDGAVICIDIKGELYQDTAHVRRKIGPVYRWDPTQPCDQYNPILACSTPRKAEDLARSIIPLAEKDPFFSRAAQGIFSAAILEGYYSKQTLPEIARRVNRTKLIDLANELVNSPCPGVPDLASIALDISENTAANVAAELRTHTKSFSADAEYVGCISRSDWTSASLEEGSTIYLTVPEEAIEQYRSILNVILDQTIAHMTKRPEKQNPPIMVMIDELPRLGKIPSLVPSLGTLRSRNVHIVQIIQSLANLDDVYGATKRRVILDNCAYQLIMSASDPDSQAYLSRRAGQKTVKTRNVSRSRMGGEERNVSESEIGAPLIRPEEFATLGDRPVLFIRGMQPVRLKKTWFFSDPNIKAIYNSVERVPEPVKEYDTAPIITHDNVVPLKKTGNE